MDWRMNFVRMNSITSKTSTIGGGDVRGIQPVSGHTVTVVGHLILDCTKALMEWCPYLTRGTLSENWTSYIPTTEQQPITSREYGATCFVLSVQVCG